MWYNPASYPKSKNKLNGQKSKDSNKIILRFEKISSNKEEDDNKNYKSNLIKNLSYNLDLQDNSKYVIFADESELLYESDVELV